MATLSQPTLVRLLNESRALLNQPDPYNSSWTDEILTNWLNEGVRQYFTAVTRNLEGHFTTTTTLNVVSGTDTIALPSDCFEVRALYKSVSNGYQILPYQNNLSQGYSTQGGGSIEGFNGYYYFRGNSLVLRPVPNFSQTGGLLLEYIQFPDYMVNGGDSLTSGVSPIFRDLIIMYAVYKAKLQESLVSGTDTASIARQELARLAQDFENAVALRSAYPTFIEPFNPE